MDDPEIQELIVQFGSSCAQWWAYGARQAAARGQPPPTPEQVARSCAPSLGPALLARMNAIEAAKGDPVLGLPPSRDDASGATARPGSAVRVLPPIVKSALKRPSSAPALRGSRSPTRRLGDRGGGGDGASPRGPTSPTRQATGGGAGGYGSGGGGGGGGGIAVSSIGGNSSSGWQADGADAERVDEEVFRHIGRLQVNPDFAAATRAEVQLVRAMQLVSEGVQAAQRAAAVLKRQRIESIALRERLLDLPAGAQEGLVATIHNDIRAMVARPIPWADAITSLDNFELFTRISRGSRIRPHRYYPPVKCATYAARVRKRALPIRKQVRPRPRSALSRGRRGRMAKAVSFEEGHEAGVEAGAGEIEPELDRRVVALQIFVQPVIGGAVEVDLASPGFAPDSESEESDSEGDNGSVDDGAETKSSTGLDSAADNRREELFNDQAEEIPLKIKKIFAEQFRSVTSGSRMPPHMNIMRAECILKPRIEPNQLPNGWDLQQGTPGARVILAALPLCPRTLHSELVHRRAHTLGEPPFFKEKGVLMIVLQLAKGVQHMHKYRYFVSAPSSGTVPRDRGVAVDWTNYCCACCCKQHRGLRPEKVFLCHGLKGPDGLTKRLPMLRTDEDDLFQCGLKGDPGANIKAVFDAAEFLAEDPDRTVSLKTEAFVADGVDLVTPREEEHKESDHDSKDALGIEAKADYVPQKGDFLFHDGIIENTRVVIGGVADSLDCALENLPATGRLATRIQYRIPPPSTIDDDRLERNMTEKQVDEFKAFLETMPPGSRLSKHLRRDFGAAPIYWPPELTLPAFALDKPWGSEVTVDFSKQDEYAIGKIMWQMMTLEPPYHGSEHAIRAGTAARREAPECYSPPCRRLVTEMLSLDPHRRPNAQRIEQEAELIMWCLPRAGEVISTPWAQERLRELRNRLLRKLPGTPGDTIRRMTVEDALLAEFLSSERASSPQLLEKRVRSLVHGPF